MKKWSIVKRLHRKKRAQRVRKKARGTDVKPRLSVVKTNQHILVQLIDDSSGHTIGSTSTLSKEFRGTEYNRKNKTSAKALGEKIAEIAKSMNIQEVVFDRGHHKYQGVLSALADAARAAGLKF